jgi:hypothetical protein
MVAIAERAKEQARKVEKVTHEVEKAALEIPSSAYMGFGLACCATASCLALVGNRRLAALVGMWAPAAFSLALYMKLECHDKKLQEHIAHQG